MNRFRLQNAIFVLTVLLGSLAAFSAEPDFYIDFSTCRNTFGALTLSEPRLATDKGDPLVNACRRNGRRITCHLHFEGGQQGHKGNIAEYLITLDSPPLLHFELLNGIESITINTVERAATLVSLISHTHIRGAKVCHGMFLTADEIKHYNAKEKSKR